MSRKSRPQTSYGSRKGSAKSISSNLAAPLPSRSPERMPKHVEEIVEKKDYSSEYNFNKSHDKLKRVKSDNRKGSAVGRHHGDENLTEDDLTHSMPERMMRLNVKGRAGSTSPHRHRSFEGGLNMAGDASPVLIRSQTMNSNSRPDRRGSKAEITNAKLAMMKKKLSPLPSRHQFASSTEDLRGDLSGPPTPT